MIKHILIAGVAVAAMLGGTAMADGHATKDKITEKTNVDVYGEVVVNGFAAGGSGEGDGCGSEGVRLEFESEQVVRHGGVDEGGVCGECGFGDGGVVVV